MTTDDTDALAIARSFQNVPWNEFLLTVAMVLSTCQARGIFPSGDIPLLLASLIGSTEPRAMFDAADRLLASPSADPREGAIEALYAQLHALADPGVTDDPGREAEYQECLARLRALQEIEAGEMARFASARRHLQPGAVEADFDRIAGLLETYEDPAV